MFFSGIFNFFFAISLTKRAIFTTMFIKSEKSTKKAENLKFRSQSNFFSFTKMFAMQNLHNVIQTIMAEQIICSNPEIEYPINFLAARTNTLKSLFEKIMQSFFLPRIYLTDTDDSQDCRRKEEIFLTLIRVGFLGFLLRWG